MLSRGGLPLSEPPDPGEATDITDVPFGATTQRAVARDGYWVGPQVTRELVFHDQSGAARTIVRWQGPPLTVTEADKSAFVEQRIATTRDDELRVALRGLGSDAFQFPSSFPSHGALLAASDGALWTADYRKPGDTGGTTWTVLAADGSARVRVGLPVRRRSGRRRTGCCSGWRTRWGSSASS